jgi:hypothetical protein
MLIEFGANSWMVGDPDVTGNAALSPDTLNLASNPEILS